VAEILLDRAEIVRAAAEHLASCGIRRIGLMSATPQPDADAWESAFRNLAGQGCSDLVHLPRSAGGRDQSLARLGRWVASLPSGVGIIAINDSDAAAAVDACRRISRAVPADIAIVGVGNDEILCEVCRPSLTSVDLGLARLGHEAVRILDSLFTDDRHVPSSLIMVAPSHVVPRRSSDTFAAGDPLVAEALQAMRRQLASDLTPQRLARDFGLSRTSLERRFKAALGRSIHDELLRLRITEAKRLLMETPLPIREVATAVGYGSVQYMTTVIRRHCGITPAQLRETAGRAPLGDRPDDPEPS
jgi:LacI family transcriptional regulator